MKIFNNIEQLLAYMKFCPFCQANCRQIDMTMGPDNSFFLSSYKKDINKLILTASFRKTDIIEYHIDTFTNQFHITFYPDNTYSPTIIEQQSPFLFIQSNCKQCNDMVSFSYDIEINHCNKYLWSIGLELDVLRPKIAHITEVQFDYITEKLSVLYKGGTKVFSLFDLNLLNFNEQNFTDKIKILLTFS